MAEPLIIDKNLSYKLASQITELSSNVTHVSHEGLDSSLDVEIWNYAKEKNMTILTKDTDFKTLSSLFGCPPKVIRLNCGNKPTKFIQKLLVSRIEVVKSFLADEEDCYLELT